MTGSLNWIFALSALLLVFQVHCEEQNTLNNFDGFDDSSFVPLPVKMRVRRDTSLSNDDCHLFQNRDLPLAQQNINKAWEKSMTAVQNITQAISDVKACLSWNVFNVIPCAIHSSIELFYSYRTYKPQLTQLVHDVRQSAGDATTTFFGCAKILIVHQNK